jgi:hypothetical protein
MKKIMMTLTLIQGLIFISYVTFLMIRFKGPLHSISESWYALGDPLNILFTLFCWSLAFTMFFQTNGTSGFFFLSGGGLGFVGAATMFKLKDGFTDKCHFIGATVGIVSALVALIYERGLIAPLIAFAIATLIIVVTKMKNDMWWIEIAAFLAIIIGLLVSC